MNKDITIGWIGLGKLGMECSEVFAEHYPTVGFDTHPVTSGTVKVLDTVEETIQQSDWIFIAVPTPHAEEYGGSEPSSHLTPKDFDYSIVKEVLGQINQYATAEKNIVLVSTVLPGTTRREFDHLLDNHTLIYNPYLIAMGSTKWDMVNPEMLIIGSKDGLDARVEDLIDIYAPLMENSPRVETGTWEEAEGIKIFYNCYSSDTEVLTDDGWKLFPEITLSNNVLSLDPGTQIPEWTKPDKIVGRPHCGAMIHFHSSKDDVLVTADHNMYVGTQITSKEKSYDYKWQIMPAREVIQKNQFAFTRSTNWHNDSPENIDLGFIKIPTTDYVSLMAWFLSEGCVHKNRIIISQDKEKNAEKYNMIKETFANIKKLFNTTNIICEGNTGLSFLNKELGLYLSQFGKSFDKYIPENIKSLGRDNIRLFLDLYNLGDGSSMPTIRFNGEVENDKKYKYYASSSDQMAADIGELIVKVGHFPSYRTSRSDLSNKDCNLIYELITNVSNYQRSGTNGLKYTEVNDYNDNVYCVVLPKNHIFLTRRNGKCTWQGNTFISAKIGLVNMIQDFSMRIGNMNSEVVAGALARSDMRIMGPNYMVPGMGDSGACHPRDNIALRSLGERYDVEYDIFDTIMYAREKQAEYLADFLLLQSERTGLPIVIHGKAYKPDVPYTTGSYSTLIGHYLEQAGKTVLYADPLTGDTLGPMKAVVLLAHNREITYGYTGNVDKDTWYFPMQKGSVIVDPWRRINKALPDFEVIHYGDTRHYE